MIQLDEHRPVAVLAVVAATIVPGVVNGQPQPIEPVKTVRLSGVFTDSKGAPMAGKTVEFQDLTVLYQSHDAKQSTSALTTTSDGGFVRALRTNDEYVVILVDPDDPDPADPVILNIGKIVVTGGQDIDLGKIVLKSRTTEAHGGGLVGPVTVTPTLPLANSMATSKLLITAIFCGADGPNIIHQDGTVIRLPNEKDQVDISSVHGSDDQTAVGWLADFRTCCTSDPLSAALIVYRPKRPLRRFTGDGRPIFAWRFADGGKRIAFLQSFLHGELREHCELRDVSTERLIANWEDDEDLTPNIPKWAKGLGWLHDHPQ